MGEFVSNNFVIMQFQQLILFAFQLTVCPKRVCISTVGVRKDLFKRNPHQVPITDFFGSVRPVEVLTNIFNETVVLENKTEKEKSIVRKKYSYVPPLVNFASLK